MNFEIIGDNLQMVRINTTPGESIYAEAGSMVNMSGHMQMDTEIKGGIISGIRRAVAGESIFLTRFYSDQSGFVSFAGTMPGKIFTVKIAPGREFVAQRDSFLCCEEGVELGVAFTEKIRAGLFGGEGFILENITGNGTAFLHCCGDIVEIALKAGEVIKVQTGLVVGFDKTVTYDIALAGGISSALFGGEGLFVTTLTGPGNVVLQSMDIAKLVSSLIPYLPKAPQVAKQI